MLKHFYNPRPDEEWVYFGEATDKISQRLDLSRGSAERTLRELCARGRVRSLRHHIDIDDLLGPAELIRPSEWFSNLSSAPDEYIDVSEADLLDWLDKQHPLEPLPAKGKTVKKRELVERAINDLWPDGILEALTKSQIEKQVGDWLTIYCKQNRIPKPDIGHNTIIHAANRRR
jgi:hypothetical protein